MFDRIINVLTKIIQTIVAISVGALALILIVNVFFRYVLRNPIIGADELALLLLVWITFLGVCLSIKERNMVAVTFLVEKFPRTISLATQIFIQLSIFLFSVLFLFIGYNWVTSPSIINASSPALQIPIWIPYLLFPISMLIMAIFSLNNIRLVLIKNKGVK